MIPNIPNPHPTLLPYLARDGLFERLGGLEEACEGGVEAWWEPFLFKYKYKSRYCTLVSVLLSRSFRSLARNLKGENERGTWAMRWHDERKVDETKKEGHKGRMRK